MKRCSARTVRELREQLEQARADRRFAEDISVAIARRHGRVPLAVFAENTDRKSVAARREVAHMLRALGWSLPRIARALGRHHCSVLGLLRTPPANDTSRAEVA